MEITYDQIDGLEFEQAILSSETNVGLDKLKMKSIVLSSKITATGRIENLIKVFIDDNEVASTHCMHRALKVYNEG